jgi:xanthine dehydrogenase accessory factor
VTRAPGHVLVLLRGAGDLATGVAWRLKRAGFGVVMCELEHPLAVRRAVAFSTAVGEGSVTVEGIRAVRASVSEAITLAYCDVVPVVISPGLPPLPADVVVDARMAKRVLDTTIDDAPLVLALGPGFTAGRDCHAVVETMRGSRLGRVFWQGCAAPNTGTPGMIGGRGAERVLRAPAAGVVRWHAAIGDMVAARAVLGTVGDTRVCAPFAGLVRGLVADGTPVAKGLKIGDVDPRTDTDWREISDKALAVAGGVLEAVLTWLTQAAASGRQGHPLEPGHVHQPAVGDPQLGDDGQRQERHGHERRGISRAQV